MTKNKWMKYILKIRNKQINKVKLQERKKIQVLNIIYILKKN